MDFNLEQHVNGRQNISITVSAIYTPEELEALTEMTMLFKPCIGAIYADLGAWRDTYIIRNPTFHQFYDPGIHIEGFSEHFANRFIARFDNNYGHHIKNALAPILQTYRRLHHEHLERERDTYFGAKPELPFYTPPKLPG